MRKNLDLECASCGSTQNVKAVCHHCGRPLCNRDKCQFEVEDKVFSGKWPVKAIHCRHCLETHHPDNKLRKTGKLR